MNLRALTFTLAAALPLWAGGAGASADGARAFTHGYAVSLAESPQLVAEAHADEPFTLMSVVKFPLAIYVLHEVEQGRLNLHTRYRLTAEELDQQTWSPLARNHPQGGEFTLLQLLHAAVAESDNNACAYLFRLTGGASALQAYLCEQMGRDVAIIITCGENYFRDLNLAVGNHATPRAMVALLRACFIEQRLLSRHSTRVLWDIMSSPSAGGPRLGAGLPVEATLAHKTGSSGTRDSFTMAYNDVGVIRLANGRQACVASFIRDSREGSAEMNAAHALLAARVFRLLEGAPPPEEDAK